MEAKIYIDAECENWENHTPEPPGHLQWHAWAEEKSKTHMQIKCEGCGLYKIWVKSTTPYEEKHGE